MSDTMIICWAGGFAETRGIYNIAGESADQGFGISGPRAMGAEWAFGPTASCQSLTYTTWGVAAHGKPQHLVGQNMVLRRIADDISFDIRLPSWGGPEGRSRTSAPWTVLGTAGRPVAAAAVPPAAHRLPRARYP